MAITKLPLLCLTLVVACGAMQANYFGGGSNAPRVLIEKSSNMSPSMELDASDFLKDAITKKSPQTHSEICNTFRQSYATKYDGFTWHVVMYKAYSIQPIKSIELKVDNDMYILFGTKK
ncbi:hypothetical protein RI129_009941 [Pyrocoelia pectoralis]|uniref:Uncharacterized protein n=1 Tax=Pyrocoelia pectoralis TaxID=417401 RepID=A0AAN7V8A1_9COLE